MDPGTATLHKEWLCLQKLKWRRKWFNSLLKDSKENDKTYKKDYESITDPLNRWRSTTKSILNKNLRTKFQFANKTEQTTSQKHYNKDTRPTIKPKRSSNTHRNVQRKAPKNPDKMSKYLRKTQ